MNVSEIAKQFDSTVIIIDIIWLAGVLLFCNWLLKTSFGRRALADSAPRRNNMPPYLPLIPLLIFWFVAVSMEMLIKDKLLPELADWQDAVVDNLISCIGSLAATVVIVFLARATFVRQLKGFGLNVKTIGKDFLAAVVNLVAIWPVAMVMIMVTILLGELIWGQEFKMPQHKELELITAYSQLSVRVLIIATTIVIVPVFEEMFFRGLFQTMLRSFLARPWLSILISSGLFATVHANPGHWPALFALSICMGYSYEKSGSLFRPIFIHSLFNAVSIISALKQ
jgi:membrane protease YdiL (CAAX protease family)